MNGWTILAGIALVIVGLIVLERWTAERNARFNAPPHFERPTWARGQ